MCTEDDMRQCDISVATFRQQVYWARPEYNRVYKWIFDRFLFLFIPIEIATQITIMNNDRPNLSQIRDFSHRHFILALHPKISNPTTHSLWCYIGLKRGYFVINFICRFHTTLECSFDSILLGVCFLLLFVFIVFFRGTGAKAQRCLKARLSGPTLPVES